MVCLIVNSYFRFELFYVSKMISEEVNQLAFWSSVYFNLLTSELLINTVYVS